MTTKLEEPFSLAGRRILVLGHRGMLGSALVKRLAGEPCEIVIAERGEVDLRRQDQVLNWLNRRRPDVILNAAGRVGNVASNATHPADFLYDNLAIQMNVIQAAKLVGVRRLATLATSAVYPNSPDLPLAEDRLLTGPVDHANQGYAIAAIAGIKMCEVYREQYGCDFMALIPANVYGPGDDFTPGNARVAASLLLQAHEVKHACRDHIEIWGSGDARRDFLYVDDLVDAVVHMIQWADTPVVNVGTGSDIAIRELAETVCEVVGCACRIRLVSDKPEGATRKLLDVTRAADLGWRAATDLRQGLEKTYAWYLESLEGPETPRLVGGVQSH